MTYTVTDTARYTLILWSVISTILSLVGNTTVLIASRKYRALKLDKYSTRLIDNLAAADIGYTLTDIVPTIGALAADGWIYGTQLCVVDKFLTDSFYSITPLIVALLCVSKLTCLISPLRAHTRTTRPVILVVLLVWFVVITACLVSTVVYRSNIYYDNLSFQCWVDYTHREYFGTFLIVYMILVAVVILATTIWLLVLAKKIAGSVQKRGSTAIIAVCAIYSLATVPTAVRMAMELTPWYLTWTEDAKAISEILTLYSFYLTNFSNPIVYYFSLRSFREFVDGKIFRRSNEGDPPLIQNNDETQTTSRNSADKSESH